MTNKDEGKKKIDRKAYRKAYYQANRERLIEEAMVRYKANRERIAVKRKIWLEANREKLANYNRNYRKSNRERLLSCRKMWGKANREWILENNRKRKAEKRNSVVFLTESEKAELLFLENTRKTLQRETGQVYHLDHILPLAHGGIHHPVNLRILEGKENLSKNAKLLPEAIDLAPEHFRLYNDRVSPERAWEFVSQLAEGLGISEEELDCLVEGTIPQIQESKSPLEDFME